MLNCENTSSRICAFKSIKYTMAIGVVTFLIIVTPSTLHNASSHETLEILSQDSQKQQMRVPMTPEIQKVRETLPGVFVCYLFNFLFNSHIRESLRGELSS